MERSGPKDDRRKVQWADPGLHDFENSNKESEWTISHQHDTGMRLVDVFVGDILDRWDIKEWLG